MLPNSSTSPLLCTLLPNIVGPLCSKLPHRDPSEGRAGNRRDYRQIQIHAGEGWVCHENDVIVYLLGEEVIATLFSQCPCRLMQEEKECNIDKRIWNGILGGQLSNSLPRCLRLNLAWGPIRFFFKLKLGNFLLSLWSLSKISVGNVCSK